MQISEKEFEDWAARNIARFLDRQSTFHVCQQYRLLSGGIVDILAMEETPHEVTFHVIELKAERIDDGALLQLLRYMGGFRDTIEAFTKRLRGWNDHRRVAMRGVLSAPRIDPTTAEIVDGLTDVTFVKLAARIESAILQTLAAPLNDEERQEVLGDAESFASHLTEGIGRTRIASALKPPSVNGTGH